MPLAARANASSSTALDELRKSSKRFRAVELEGLTTVEIANSSTYRRLRLPVCGLPGRLRMGEALRASRAEKHCRPARLLDGDGWTSAHLWCAALEDTARKRSSPSVRIRGVARLCPSTRSPGVGATAPQLAAASMPNVNGGALLKGWHRSGGLRSPRRRPAVAVPALPRQKAESGSSATDRRAALTAVARVEAPPAVRRPSLWSEPTSRSTDSGPPASVLALMRRCHRARVPAKLDPRCATRSAHSSEAAGPASGDARAGSRALPSTSRVSTRSASPKPPCSGRGSARSGESRARVRCGRRGETIDEPPRKEARDTAFDEERHKSGPSVCCGVLGWGCLSPDVELGRHLRPRRDIEHTSADTEHGQGEHRHGQRGTRARPAAEHRARGRRTAPRPLGRYRTAGRVDPCDACGVPDPGCKPASTRLWRQACHHRSEVKGTMPGASVLSRDRVPSPAEVKFVTPHP